MSKSTKKDNSEFDIKNSGTSSISRIEELGSDYSSSTEEPFKPSYSHNSDFDTSFDNIFQNDSNNNNIYNSDADKENIKGI